MAHYFLGQVYVQLGRLDDAVSELETAIGLSGETPEMVATLAHAHAVAGRHEKAKEMITTLRDRSSERFVSPALIAQVYAGLGETDLAFDWLENGYVVKAPEMMWIGVRPVFQALAADPRMDDLRSRIGLQISANSCG
jgi:tetratricopeptide (TPR) repeat protein